MACPSEMCSSRSICGATRPPNSRSSSSGAHYALCALGVGLIALGVVMIVWTVMPSEQGGSSGSTAPTGNSTAGPGSGGNSGHNTDPKKSSLVAIVLVAAGGAILLLSICLGLRNKRRTRNRRDELAAAQAPLRNQVVQPQEEPGPDPAAYSVPSYEEVVGSDNYPVRQSNLRQSITQLPSYEDIIAAVESEGAAPPAESAPLSDRPPAGEARADPAANPRVPVRSSSRASRLLRPLRVRRIKSDKLHLKDFRLQIRTPTQNPVTIEPITPPPQYENKMPELQ
ncbi:transmembrane protein 51b [Betta splendens]|uniref:Transmembrane protein 51b n=1 Tax=Betta splendens TaxID=158456 RepID=A0A9W2XTG2_BETSP|nr:transmembrane protein 51b [Betta splendens]